MNYFQAVLLGLLQGIAEFLPVSSSGHLFVLRRFMGIPDVPPLFDILLHLATLLVIFIIFRKRIWTLIKTIPVIFKKNKSEEQKEDSRWVGGILLAFVITMPLAFLISQLDFFQSNAVVSTSFIATGCLLLAVRFLKKDKPLQRLHWWQSAVIGFSQGLGVIPGISRSGITISAGVLSGLDREKAADFSFILAIPTILAAFVYDLKNAENLLAVVNVKVLAVAFMVAFITGIGALLLLMRLLKKGQFFFFSFYLIPLGILCFIFL